MKKRFLALVFILVVVRLTAPLTRGVTVAIRSDGQPADARLVGTWRFVSDAQRFTDGSVRPSPEAGPHGVGYLMYDDARRMCVVFTNPDRPKWKSTTEPDVQELRAMFEGFAAYCGRYDVNEAEGFVVHHTEVGMSPNSFGSDRRRYFKFEGDKLVLRVAPPSLPKDVVEWTVIWERVHR
jgi:hypothetical protein